MQQLLVNAALGLLCLLSAIVLFFFIVTRRALLPW
jgi:hypothetical protein